MDYKIENEGVDHINAYSKSQTKLGKFLSNWENTDRIEFVDGFFKSLEGYWFYLKTKDERFRRLKGFQAKALAKELGVDGDLNEEQREKFKEATWAKLLSKCCFVCREYNSLPIVHYYVYGNKVIKAGPQWWIDYLNESLPKFKNKIEPILKKLEEKGWSPYYNEHYWTHSNNRDYNGSHPIFLAIQENLISAKELIYNKD